jgi:ribosome recycling factor
MEESLEPIFNELKEGMKKALDHLTVEMGKLRAGKAHTSMLDSITIEYYGSVVPLNQVGSVSTPDARTLVIQPWEKSILKDIERAIINGNLGFNPQSDGEVIIINIPAITEERRLSLVKSVKAEAEHAKVSLRNIRRDSNSEIKRLQKDGFSEDLAKDAESDVQKIIDDYSTKIDDMVSKKEVEIMTV